jgi:hypothetical protein
MAPFLPYRSTEEASFISGAVFTVTGNGRVTLYSDPEPTAEIQKDGAPWSVDELIETVPLTLLKGLRLLGDAQRWG